MDSSESHAFELAYCRFRASHRISSKDAMAASTASHADLRNARRSSVLAVADRWRCRASCTRCLRANGSDLATSSPPAAVTTWPVAASDAARICAPTTPHPCRSSFSSWTFRNRRASGLPMAICSSLNRAVSRGQAHRAAMPGSSMERAKVMPIVCSWPGMEVRRSTVWRNASMRVSVFMAADWFNHWRAPCGMPRRRRPHACPPPRPHRVPPAPCRAASALA